ncbi:cholesterol esterase [Cladochytrium tenue]|nr:cholesterol esterase [Cladochytrium tenue]
MHIPILGRLTLADYTRLFFAVLFLITEPVLRFVFFVFPPLRWLADFVRRALASHIRISAASGGAGIQAGPAFSAIGSPPSGRLSGFHIRSPSGSSHQLFNLDGALPFSPIIATDAEAEGWAEQLHTTEDFVRFWGFPFESHYTTTPDGYILSLHRIPGSRSDAQLGTDQHSKKPVILLWHGFMMCSEVWVCSPDPHKSLPYVLAEAGYDVWLGNTRGNKYSCKHTTLKPTDEAFWDFGLDHLALFDLKSSVEYITALTGVPSLSYIGFSQGTMQGFSALSMSPQLNKLINLFIALAPATKPLGIDNKLIHALVNTSPEVIYLLFGRRNFLSSTLFWQGILTPATYSSVINLAVWCLFSWNSDMIAFTSTVYRHLYSYTSVKIVVQWFQIIRTGRFQMYDDNPTVVPNAATGHLVPKFPTENIKTPYALFWGGQDSLADVSYILRTSPAPVFCLKVEEYEHLSFLWGRAIDKVVFPGILGLLAQHAVAPTTAPSNGANAAPPSVPWICPADSERALELGRGREPVADSVASGTSPSPGPLVAWADGLEYAGAMSVAPFLRRASSASAKPNGVVDATAETGSPAAALPLPRLNAAAAGKHRRQENMR